MAVAWLAQRGIVVIPKSVTASRIVANRDVGFALSAEDMAAVSALNKDFRNGWGGPKVERCAATERLMQERGFVFLLREGSRVGPISAQPRAERAVGHL